MDNSFDIDLVLEVLKRRHKIFRNEDDLKVKLHDVIRDIYRNLRVETEYYASFDNKKDIDIVVITDNGYYPIELKYKKRAFNGIVDNIEYNFSTDNAQNIGRYLFLKDIERIEKFRNHEPLFKKGYTIFITNDLSYLDITTNEDTEFSIHENAVKTGTLNWNRETLKTGYEEPITLKGAYTMNWKEYSKINDETAGTFMYLVNEVDK
ncbi:MAG: hypothetical protein OSJ63_03965 [Bacilli bacterium]|nr:hypothetical protein [Bacilli bacterium]